MNAPVLKAEDAGWDGDALEAEGFAYLAVRSKQGLAAVAADHHGRAAADDGRQVTEQG